MSDEKRRKFWIDPPRQTRMVCWTLLFLGASFLIVYLSIDQEFERTGKISDSIIISIDAARHLIRESLYIPGAIVLIAGGLLTLWASHRIIGPLMVLLAGLRRIREGDLTMDVQPRDTDSMREIIRDFSKMQAALREMVLKDREHLKHIHAKLDDLAAKLHANHSSVEEIQFIQKELNKVSSSFKL